MINRRDLLGIAASAGAASLLTTSRTQAEEEQPAASFKIVDTNVSLFHWPFRRLPLDSTAALLKKMQTLGIASAWAGSFEGVLHRDISSVNKRLTDECRRHGQLSPVGSINPELPDWENDLRLCIQQHKMHAVRLHPNYHGYALDDPRLAKLLEITAKERILVQLVAAMEDTRTQHPLVRVDDVDLSPLPDLMRRFLKAKIQILNYRPRAPLLEKLAKSPGVYFDTARVESTDGVPNLVKRVPAGRVMFGSHAPLLIPEAALIRVHESSQLDEPALRTLLSDNASRLAGRKRS